MGQFKKLFFHLIEQALRRGLVKPEFKYPLGFLRKSKITTRCTVNIDVYNTFLKQFKKFFFHLIEHALKSLLVFKYLWLSLRKSKITAGDSLNSRLSIYAPKKVLVKKYVIYIKQLFTG